MQALLVHVKIAQEERHFKMVLQALLERFKGESGQVLLQKRGTLIIRGLCGMLGGTKVFSELATILEAEVDCVFAATITQALNLMLLSAPELSSLRSNLQNALRDPESAKLLQTLYSCWSHSACAALSLCMLAQAYQHVGALIHELAELPLVPVLLAQVDRCAMCSSAFLWAPQEAQKVQMLCYMHLVKRRSTGHLFMFQYIYLLYLTL
jgi:vacuole morphology and inheritance protein 14